MMKFLNLCACLYLLATMSFAQAQDLLILTGHAFGDKPGYLPGINDVVTADRKADEIARHKAALAELALGYEIAFADMNEVPPEAEAAYVGVLYSFAKMSSVKHRAEFKIYSPTGETVLDYEGSWESSPFKSVKELFEEPEVQAALQGLHPGEHTNILDFVISSPDLYRFTMSEQGLSLSTVGSLKRVVAPENGSPDGYFAQFTDPRGREQLMTQLWNRLRPTENREPVSDRASDWLIYMFSHIPQWQAAGEAIDAGEIAKLLFSTRIERRDERRLRPILESFFNTNPLALDNYMDNSNARNALALYAIEDDNGFLFELLAKRGAYNTLPQRELALRHAAIHVGRNRNFDYLEGLIARGYDLNEPVGDDAGVLAIAMMSSPPKARSVSRTVDKLLEMGANPAGAPLAGEAYSPLLVAAMRNDLKAADALLKAGADANFGVGQSVNRGFYLAKTARETLSQYELRAPEASHIRNLIDESFKLSPAALADQFAVELDNKRLWLEERPVGTLLDAAIRELSVRGRYGSRAVVDESIIEAVSPENFLDSGGGIAPIHAAVQARNLEFVDLLISHGGDINLGDMNGRTPLFYAYPPSSVPMSEDDRIFIRALLERGADPTFTDVNGLTAEDYQSLLSEVFAADLEAANIEERERVAEIERERQRQAEIARMEAEARRERERRRQAEKRRKREQFWNTFTTVVLPVISEGVQEYARVQADDARRNAEFMRKYDLPSSPVEIPKWGGYGSREALNAALMKEKQQEALARAAAAPKPAAATNQRTYCGYATRAEQIEALGHGGTKNCRRIQQATINVNIDIGGLAPQRITTNGGSNSGSGGAMSVGDSGVGPGQPASSGGQGSSGSGNRSDGGGFFAPDPASVTTRNRAGGSGSTGGFGSSNGSFGESTQRASTTQQPKFIQSPMIKQSRMSSMYSKASAFDLVKTAIQNDIFDVCHSMYGAGVDTATLRIERVEYLREQGRGLSGDIETFAPEGEGYAYCRVFGHSRGYDDIRWCTAGDWDYTKCAVTNPPKPGVGPGSERVENRR